MRQTYEELLACAERATDQKRNVPDSLESWDARRITLPRNLRQLLPTAMGNPRFSTSTPARVPVVDRYWFPWEPGWAEAAPSNGS